MLHVMTILSRLAQFAVSLLALITKRLRTAKSKRPLSGRLLYVVRETFVVSARNAPVGVSSRDSHRAPPPANYWSVRPIAYVFRDDPVGDGDGFRVLASKPPGATRGARSPFRPVTRLASVEPAFPQVGIWGAHMPSGLRARVRNRRRPHRHPDHLA